MKLRMLCVSLLLLAAPVLLVAQSKNERVVVPPQTVKPKATAHNAHLAWTAPTTCVDGSACSPSGYNVYKATVACPATGLPAGAAKIASAITATTYDDGTISAPGVYCYYVTALNSSGESTASNTGGGSLAQPAISAPTNFSVTVN